MSKNSCLYIVLLIVFLLSLPAAAFGVSLRLQPKNVLISAFYDGATVEATGEVPQDCRALILVRGPGEDVHLKKKGKVGGLLWMNMGNVTFQHTPCVYMLYADSNLSPSLDAEVGFPALKKVIDIIPANENKNFLFGEFLKLKESQSLYAVHLKSVSYIAGSGDMRSFKATIIIPPRMRPGDYTVQAFAVKDGHVLNKASEDLRIKLTGFPHEIEQLAFGHSLIYGIIAVLVALTAGLFIGIVFKGKGGAH
ncbi:MAG: hypothetical protein GWP10_01235 [Nitrospiraceae bacterium]|nr:hypothetical protein [Nitrospiraceae bacterium]